MPPLHLFFLRHGIAEDRGIPGIPDSDRPLTDKGRKRLAKSLKTLARLKQPIEGILSSSLVRAYQTAEMARDILNIPAEIEIESQLAPGGTLAEFLKKLKDREETTLLLTGHEPDLSSWIADLLGCESGEPIVMKKGSVAHLSLDWHRGLPTAQLLFLLSPRLSRALSR